MLYRNIAKYSFTWIQKIHNILPPECIIQDLNELKTYNTDWTNQFTGRSTLAIAPKSTQQISQLLQIFNQHKIKVVPQGGRTGLVGGGVPADGEVILLMKNLNQIEKFDEITNILTVQAGCVLETANNYISQYNCQIPWDLGARGTCQIGGNIATNAGGINVVKNGLLRGYIVGLEVVLPNGQIVDLSSENRKDNTGLDLKQLFIGSEGILGVVTKANIQCLQRNEEQKLIFIECSNFQQVIECLKISKKVANNTLSAFEFMEGKMMKQVSQKFSLPCPFEQRDDKNSYYALIELSGQYNIESLSELLAEKIVDKEECTNCIINKNETEFNQIWKLREFINETLAQQGKVLKYDLSLPPNEFENYMDKTFPNRNKIDSEFTTFYGHVGDGNIHINVLFENQEKLKQKQQEIEKLLYKNLMDLKGSISAEHGVGQFKKQKLEQQKGHVSLELMKEIKRLFDPNNIMNPGKVIDG